MNTNDNHTQKSDWISDEELDRLISTSLERESILEEINRNVMNEVKHSARKAVFRRYARVFAFAFGIPFVLFCFGFGIHYIVTHSDMPFYMWIALGLSAIAMLGFVSKEVRDFSISKM